MHGFVKMPKIGTSRGTPECVYMIAWCNCIQSSTARTQPLNRYVRAYRERRQIGKHGFLELEWRSGEAQANFGECDVFLNGVRQVCKYPMVTFPYSNAGFVQCFLGETSACLCQGLMDIFDHIGGVPPRIVIDNATAAVRRIGELVRLTQLFKRFQAHFGFQVTFCNPNSGHEKGNVENKVGYARRNYLVPPPSKASMLEWNTELFALCDLDNFREQLRRNITTEHLSNGLRRGSLVIRFSFYMVYCDPTTVTSPNLKGDLAQCGSSSRMVEWHSTLCQ